MLAGGAARKDLSVLIVGEKCPKRELELIEHLLVLSRLSQDKNNTTLRPWYKCFLESLWKLDQGRQ